MHIGQRIKALMAVRKVSTSAMAVHCEVTRGAVSNWFVNGRITKTNLAKVAEKLRTTTDRLISYDVDEILELEANDRATGARSIAPALDAARGGVGRQTYSLDALEVAHMFDQLPGELAKRRATAYVENLLVRNPSLAAASSELAAPRKRAAPRKPVSAPPTPAPRPALKTSRAKRRT